MSIPTNTPKSSTQFPEEPNFIMHPRHREQHRTELSQPTNRLFSSADAPVQAQFKIKQL